MPSNLNPDEPLPPAPADNQMPAPEALAEAAKLIQAASGTEETRFNNLNSRAIALLSASSLVTSLAGLFGKEILSTTTLGNDRTTVAGLLILVVACLVLASGLVVIKVLLPNRRATFGDNALTNSPGSLVDPRSVHAVAFTDYSVIHASLVERNSAKATWLHRSYLVFLAGVVAIAVSVGIVSFRAMGW